jgi:enoyl-CoA hydratase
MSEFVRIDRRGDATVIVIDDGRRNVMSPAMLRALHQAFDLAERENRVVVLKGREGIFSAGFDLKVFRDGTTHTIYDMLRLGAELALRILEFPLPVVGVATGHAYPMGAFLLLGCDVRIGAAGEFRLGLNEVAIGLTIPNFGVELARQRLAPAYFQRATITGEMFGPEDAVRAGFLDHVAAPHLLDDAAMEIATTLGRIDFASHAATKLRVRRPAIAAVREAIDAEIRLDAYRRRGAPASTATPS